MRSSAAIRGRRHAIGTATTLVIMALGLALGGCGSSSGSGQPATRHAPLETILQDDPLVRADPAGTLAILARMGVDRVRVMLPWQALAPQPSAPSKPPGFDAADPAAYSPAVWITFDNIVRAGAQSHIGIDLNPTGGAPRWAAGAELPHGAPSGPWKPSAAEFRLFVEAVGRRYSGTYRPAGAPSPLPRVSFWSLWNEPNYGPDLAPQTVGSGAVEISPLLYRNLVDAGWQGLGRSGHGSDTILIGETAPRGITTGQGPGYFSGMVPLRFIRALYCVDGSFKVLQGSQATARGCPSAGSAQDFVRRHPILFHAGGFADHPYPQGLMPPDVPTPGEGDYADLAVIGNLQRTLDRAQAAYGQPGGMAIYSTEFGFQTNPPETIVRAIPPPTAAAYMNQSEYISWRDPRLRSYDQYLLRDSARAGPQGGFATGLQFASGVPKATQQAFLMPLFLPRTQGSRTAPLEVWGAVRPAAFAQRGAGLASSALLQFQPGFRGPFTTLRKIPVSAAQRYFDLQQRFPGSGAVRVSWSYPGAETIYSRTVSLALR